MPVGFGYDIHRLVKGRRLVLGGVEISYSRGLLGHSDGDAVLHAVCDAMLGAAGAGDLGTHFPNTEKRYKNISSQNLVRETMDMLRRGWTVENLDITVFVEQPRLESIKDQMRKCIAGLVEADPHAVNVKAKTMEGLGEIGAGKAIAAHAIVSLKKRTRSKRSR